uniref:Uncharacterized protein n=1 Tax=Anguilla anguilla TaxID=7936 RepID=A0A0E9TG39_ANGAN
MCSPVDILRNRCGCLIIIQLLPAAETM